MSTNARSKPTPPIPAGLKKAAILILVVGDELAREMFTRLSEEEIRNLGEAAASLKGVTRAEIMEVLLEFKRTFRGGTIPQRGAGNMFQLMVERAIGEQRARALLETEDDEDPFELCMDIEPETLAEVLEREHPQTTAVVLGSIDEKHASKVLDGFEMDYAAEVILRMARMGNSSEEIKRDIGRSLHAELRDLATQSSADEVAPEDTTVAILKRMKTEQSNDLLGLLESRDAEFAQRLRSKMFSFADLIALDSRSMQRLLREVDTTMLSRAMKGSDEDLQGLIFSSMSSRAAEMLQDDMNAMGPMRLAEVEEAQEAIIAVALRLEEEGILVIPRGGESDLV